MVTFTQILAILLAFISTSFRYNEFWSKNITCVLTSWMPAALVEHCTRSELCSTYHQRNPFVSVFPGDKEEKWFCSCCLTVIMWGPPLMEHFSEVQRSLDVLCHCCSQRFFSVPSGTGKGSHREFPMITSLLLL